MSSEAGEVMDEVAEALVPKLRFPEFRGAGAWVQTTIGEIGSFYYGKSAPKWSLEQGAPTKCVRYGELYTKFNTVISQTHSRTNIDPKNLKFSKGGEILIPRVGEKPDDFGKCCCYLPLAGVAIGEMISVFETDQVPLFYTFYFRHMYRQFAEVVEGQNVKNLYFTELEPLEICRTSIPEQRKIADCLSSLDTVNSAEGERLEALRDYKRGLMQALFPAPGETVPRLRFPDFQNAAAWKKQALGEIAHYQNGKAYEPHIVENGRYIVVNARFISTDGTAKKWSDNSLLIADEDDILMVLSDLPNGKALAKCYRVREGNRYAVNQRIAKLTPHAVRSDFLFAVLNRHPYLLGFNDGMNQTHLSKDTVLNCPILVPSDKEEQIAIANCLATLNAKIAAQVDRLREIQAHKSGLMQGLFPSPAEAIT